MRPSHSLVHILASSQKRTLFVSLIREEVLEQITEGIHSMIQDVSIHGSSSVVCINCYTTDKDLRIETSRTTECIPAVTCSNVFSLMNNSTMQQ